MSGKKTDDGLKFTFGKRKRRSKKPPFCSPFFVAARMSFKGIFNGYIFAFFRFRELNEVTFHFLHSPNNSWEILSRYKNKLQFSAEKEVMYHDTEFCIHSGSHFIECRLIEPAFIKATFCIRFRIFTHTSLQDNGISR